MGFPKFDSLKVRHFFPIWEPQALVGFLFLIPGCLLAGKWRVKKSRGLSAHYTEWKMNCPVIGGTLSWVAIEILTCLSGVTQGKRYVDARQEQSLLTASWSTLRDKGIYQQFNDGHSALAWMQVKKESAACTVRFQARLKSRVRMWLGMILQITYSTFAAHKSRHNSPEVSRVGHVSMNGVFGPNPVGVFAVSHL